MDDFEQFKTLVEEATTDVTVVKIAREQAVEPEGVTALLQSHGRAWVGKELLFTGEQRKWFLGMESTTCEDAVKIVGMTAEHLAFYVNLVDKAVAGCERTGSTLESSSPVNQMLSNSTAYYREVFKSVISLREIAIAIHHHDLSAGINNEAKCSTNKKITTHWRLRWWLAFSSKKLFFT